ncbi:MAG: thioredoxin family protein [Patescibacteria group bacterium]
MTIKILGFGHPDYQKLEDNVKYALRQLNKDVPVEKVSKISEIMYYNVRGVPALVVNDRIVGYGNMLWEGIKKILSNAK